MSPRPVTCLRDESSPCNIAVTCLSRLFLHEIAGHTVHVCTSTASPAAADRQCGCSLQSCCTDHALPLHRSFDPKMGPIARVLWECLPELLHVGAVLVVIALMLAVMGTALFGDRAASFSTFSGLPPHMHLPMLQLCSCADRCNSQRWQLETFSLTYDA